ncbi:MAG: hypothetical protein GX600_10010 [Dehalococcoidia bacterium]|nr:hypothetical protein [Dehalococcoidia bacterium]
MTNQNRGDMGTEDAETIREIVQGIAVARIQCRRETKLGRYEQAAETLSKAQQLYKELVATADLENNIHCSIVRNRRSDLGTMVAEVESCRLKHETEKVRHARRKAQGRSRT